MHCKHSVQWLCHSLLLPPQHNHFLNLGNFKLLEAFFWFLILIFSYLVFFILVPETLAFVANTRGLVFLHINLASPSILNPQLMANMLV